MIPDGCVGLPTLAAVEQGIPVIAVRNNTNLMRNDLRDLPFRDGQLHYAENYYEAAGILAAMERRVAGDARPADAADPHRAGLRGEGHQGAATAMAMVTPTPMATAMATAKANGRTNGNGHAVAAKA